MKNAGMSGAHLSARHLLAQDQRQAQRLDRLPFGRYRTGELDTPLVISDDGFVAILKDDVLVFAAHEMLVHGYVRGEEPFPAGRVFRFRLSVERVYLAPRTGHGGPVVRRHLTSVVVGPSTYGYNRLSRRLSISL